DRQLATRAAPLLPLQRGEARGLVLLAAALARLVPAALLAGAQLLERPPHQLLGEADRRAARLARRRRRGLRRLRLGGDGCGGAELFGLRRLGDGAFALGLLLRVFERDLLFGRERALRGDLARGLFGHLCGDRLRALD